MIRVARDPHQTQKRMSSGCILIDEHLRIFYKLRHSKNFFHQLKLKRLECALAFSEGPWQLCQRYIQISSGTLKQNWNFVKLRILIRTTFKYLPLKIILREVSVKIKVISNNKTYFSQVYNEMPDGVKKYGPVFNKEFLEAVYHLQKKILEVHFSLST